MTKATNSSIGETRTQNPVFQNKTLSMIPSHPNQYVISQRERHTDFSESLKKKTKDKQQ